MKKHAMWLTVFSFIATILMSTFIFAADLVNVNTADREQLTMLTGVGAIRADAIIKHREAHGPFQSLDDFKMVKGIGDRIIEANREIIIFQQGAPAAEKPDANSDDVMVGTQY